MHKKTNCIESKSFCKANKITNKNFHSNFTKFLRLIICEQYLVGYGYFVVKTALLSRFSALKWPHGRQAKIKTAKGAKRGPKKLTIFRDYYCFIIRSRAFWPLLAPFGRRDFKHSFFAIWHFLLVSAPSAVNTTE